jgi:small subunit ribosomal protein S5
MSEFATNTMPLGNGNGFVGMGQGKAVAPQKAIENAIVDARKHMVMVPLTEGSLLHETRAKFGACKVMVKPKNPGNLPPARLRV